MTPKYMNKKCGSCIHREKNGFCRHSPPAVIMVPGAPRGTIVPPGAIPITLKAVLRPVAPDFPACSFWGNGVRIEHGLADN